MKTERTINTSHTVQPKLQTVYTGNKELAAIHLISPQGIVSYASMGTVPKPKWQPEQDAAWYSNYE